MKRTVKIKLGLILALACLFFASIFLTTQSILYSYADDTGGADVVYYVCLSRDSYAQRKSNKMRLLDSGEYILEDVKLSSADKFVVSSSNGIRYYGNNNKEMSVKKAETLRYNVKFNLNGVYSEESNGYEKTDSRITYGYYLEESVTVKINDEETQLEYSPFNTQRDDYILSLIKLPDDSTITVGEEGQEGYETHTVEDCGFYRIVYTPLKTVDGNLYGYDEDGNYGTGDDYIYALSIKETSVYYVTISGDYEIADEQDDDINGEKAYRLDRNEENIWAEEYCGGGIFTSSKDKEILYKVYKKNYDESYELLDNYDVDDEDDLPKIKATDIWWYSFSYLGQTDIMELKEKELNLDGVYVFGNFNDYGFNSNGELNLKEENKFTFLTADDEDYSYDTYKLNLNVTKADLNGGAITFYITDGTDKYRNVDKDISINKIGEYEIFFSKNRIYGNGRNYYYVLKTGDKINDEIKISSVKEYNEFAKSCNENAEYSKNLGVYFVKDLDFSGEKIVTIKAFYGKIFGCYRTIKGIKLTDKESVINVLGVDAVIEKLSVELNINSKDGRNVGFVGKNYGEIKDVELTGDVLGKSYVGGLVGYNGKTANSSGATENAYIMAKITDCNVNLKLEGATNVGGVCGYNEGEIKGCKSSGKVEIKSQKISATTANAGGVCGFSSGNIIDCENNAEITSTSAIYVGGVVGHCTGVLVFCFNNANITATKYVGGICGYYGVVKQDQPNIGQDLTDFFGGAAFNNAINSLYNDNGNEDVEEEDGTLHIVSYCVNNGNVKAKSYVGGIIGFSGNILTIENCASKGEITSTVGGYCGGIAGFVTTAKAFSCLSMGKIMAEGEASYVGGIVGYGAEIEACVSNAEILGGDYVGGIIGYGTGKVSYCYTNVLIIGSKDAKNIGHIAGALSSYSESSGSFGGNVKYNYYVGENGAIGQTDYKDGEYFAGMKVASNDLISFGTLSASLCKQFIQSEYYTAPQTDEMYPLLYNFTNFDEAENWDGSTDLFDIFWTYNEKYNSLTMDCARVSYVIALMEWNKDNGDLYDDDGNIIKKNFENVKNVRIFKNEKISENFEFKYATKNDYGKYVYEGKKARYFVTFNFDGIENENTAIYADYREILTTISLKDGNVLIEGEFPKGIIAEITKSPFGEVVQFTLDGEKVSVPKITVRYKIENNERNYKVKYYNGGETNCTPEAGYISFEITGEDSFYIEENSLGNLIKKALPLWAICLICIVGGIGASVLVFVFISVRKNKKDAKQYENIVATATEEANEELKPSLEQTNAVKTETVQNTENQTPNAEQKNTSKTSKAKGKTVQIAEKPKTPTKTAKSKKEKSKLE